MNPADGPTHERSVTTVPSAAAPVSPATAPLHTVSASYASRLEPDAYVAGGVGLALGVGGFVGLVQHQSFVRTLALERSLAWVAIIAGVAVALAALLLPRFTNRSNVVEAR